MHDRSLPAALILLGAALGALPCHPLLGLVILLAGSALCAYWLYKEAKEIGKL